MAEVDDTENNRYELVSSISSGMFKDCYSLATWEACDIDNKQTELKVASMRSLGSQMKKQYLSDLILILKLKHKNICEFTHVYSVGCDIYHTLSVPNLQSLHDLLIYTSMKPKHDTISFLIWQLVEALEYLHLHGAMLLVLPLKDVIVSDKFHVSLQHFGYKYCIGGEDIAKQVNERCRYCYKIPGVTFCSPEVLCASTNIDERADCWNVGAVLAALLAKCEFMEGHCNISLSSISSDTLQTCLPILCKPSDNVVADLSIMGDFLTAFKSKCDDFEPEYLFDDCLDDIEVGNSLQVNTDMVRNLVKNLLTFSDKRFDIRQTKLHPYFHKYNQSLRDEVNKIERSVQNGSLITTKNTKGNNDFIKLTRDVSNLTDEHWKTTLYRVLLTERLKKPMSVRSLTNTCLDVISVHYEYDHLKFIQYPSMYLAEYRNRFESFLRANVNERINNDT